MIRLLPLLLVGCRDYALNKAGGDLDSGEAGAADDTAESDTYDSGDLPMEPAWYTVRATLTVLGGVPVADGATVTLDVVDADLERVDCSVPLDTTGIEAGAPPDDDVAAWWDLEVVPDGEACADLPARLGLGIGTLLPDVRARLGTVGYDDVADSLYGAYVREGGTLSVFGYAGTEADRAGDDVAATPLPDGAYTLGPLYLLEL